MNVTTTTRQIPLLGGFYQQREHTLENGWKVTDGLFGIRLSDPDNMTRFINHRDPMSVAEGIEYASEQ